MSQRTDPGSSWASEPPLPSGVIMVDCDNAVAPPQHARDTLTIGDTVWLGIRRTRDGAMCRFCAEIDSFSRIGAFGALSDPEYRATVVSAIDELGDQTWGLHLGSTVWFKPRHVLDIDD